MTSHFLHRTITLIGRRSIPTDHSVSVSRKKTTNAHRTRTPATLAASPQPLQKFAQQSRAWICRAGGEKREKPTANKNEKLHLLPRSRELPLFFLPARAPPRAQISHPSFRWGRTYRVFNLTPSVRARVPFPRALVFLF